MSTAVVTARPAQALRQRRESTRPTSARTSTAKANSMENGVTKDEANAKRYLYTQQDILAKFRGQPPSLRVHLFANHFRINDSQDSLSYASPMKELLQHIRDKTVPHNMLDELYMLPNSPFYDGCMIVEVHDHKSGGTETKKDSSISTDGNKTPFSIHNYNSFITPSPFVPYPQKQPAKPGQPDKGPEVKEDKDVDKENMPAPGQPASSGKQPAKPNITTVVLFPTIQSHLTDLQLLATTQAPDIQTYRRNQAAGRAGGNPPTPLTAVPPTPTLPTGRSPKRQKMVIDETNAHEFESAMLERTCPKLYLEPTKSLAESVALIEAMTHPNHKNPAPARKTRKRTTAELAADEAEAADMQRYMLAGDEWQATKTANTAGGEDGQPAVRGATFQTFSRFKTLESIKMHHDEAERRKKEEEALQAQAKRQAQAEQEAKKRRELEQSRQAEQNAALMQRQQELLRQQQAQQAIQQDQMRAASQAQQMANAAAAQQTPQSATQPNFSSPVVRQQTPMAAVASPLVSAHASHPMGGTPMVATSSNHGAGSPARPPSAVSHHPSSMARTVSQQHNQPMSRTGTPQMVQGTPVMNSAGPARTMAATPQPRMNQGSPTVPMQGSTPIMMQTPQPGQNMTPEAMQQMQAVQHSQMQQRLRAQMQAQGMQMSPGQNMNPQQMAVVRANAHIQQHGVPQGQNPQTYKNILMQKFYTQITQGQNQQQAQMNAQNAGGMGGQPAAQPNPQGGMNLASMTLQQLRNHYQQRRQQLVNQFGQVPAAWPQQLQHQQQQLEMLIRQKEREMQAQISQNMGNMGGMNGGQNPASMQQYQVALQQQRAHQARQQQMMAMQQRQHGMNPSQMPQGMMGNMGMMNNMNMNNMNMQNMQGMQNMGGMNMQNMSGMNMGQMNQMNQQQMQMMLMRQAQAQAQMRAGQQQRPQGDGMEWSGV